MLSALIDLVCPASCAGCGAGGAAVCAFCRRGLGRPASWRLPQPCPCGLPPVAAVADHNGAVRQLLIAHKDRGRLDVGPVLGAALARAVALAAGPGPVALVPVPSSRPACRRRGYDHALRLAQAAAAVLPGPSRAVPLLGRVRSTADQAGLTAAARAANLSGALAVTGSPPALGRAAYVVVDDLMTTGATLTEALRALRAAGIDPCGAAVIASRVKRVPPGGAEG